MRCPWQVAFARLSIVRKHLFRIEQVFDMASSRSTRWIVTEVIAVALMGLAMSSCTTGPAPAQTQSSPLVVAFLGPLSGDAASFGVSQRRGIELALDEMNSSGGVGGQPVQVVFEDTQLDQNRAIAALNKVVDVDKAVVVLGDTSSSNTMAIGPLAQRRGVLLVSPLASAANVTSSGFRIYRISPSDTFQARIAAKFAIDSGWKSASVLYTNDEWGNGLSKEFAEFFKANGGAIQESLGTEPRGQDFRPQLTRLKTNGPSVIYIPMHPDEAAVALKQARQLGLTTQFLGGDSFSEPTIAKTAGAAANGVVYTVPGSATSEVFAQFSAKYKQRYGEAPNYNAAAGYDALKIVADSAKRASSRDLSALADSLGKISGYQGASGVITFDAKGDVTSKTFDIRRLENQQSVVVKANVSLTAP